MGCGIGVWNEEQIDFQSLGSEVTEKQDSELRTKRGWTGNLWVWRASVRDQDLGNQRALSRRPEESRVVQEAVVGGAGARGTGKSGLFERE